MLTWRNKHAFDKERNIQIPRRVTHKVLKSPIKWVGILWSVKRVYKNTSIFEHGSFSDQILILHATLSRKCSYIL